MGTILGCAIEAETSSKDELLKHMSIKDMVVMSAISSDLQTMVSRHLKDSWEELLGHFFPCPSEFRDALRTSRSVVSGSVALWFVCGGPLSWFPNDCDIYTPLGESASVATFLQTRAGYSIDEEKMNWLLRNQNNLTMGDTDYPECDGAISVIASVLHLTNQTLGKYVDIIESNTVSSLQPIPRFWSTLQASYISADNLCVAYPYLTFNNIGCVTPTGYTPIRTVLDAILKYRKRGFIIDEFSSAVEKRVLSGFPGITPKCENNPYCPHALRFFGDKWCLQYAFDEKNFVSHPVDEFTVRWRYGGDACGICKRKYDSQIQTVSEPGRCPVYYFFLATLRP